MQWKLYPMIEIALGLMFGLVLGTVILNATVQRTPLKADITSHSFVLFTDPNYEQCHQDDVCATECKAFYECLPNLESEGEHCGWMYLPQQRTSWPTSESCPPAGAHVACNTAPVPRGSSADCVCEWPEGDPCPCCNKDTDSCEIPPWPD